MTDSNSIVEGFKARLTNNCSAAKYTASSWYGGLALEGNLYNFPNSVVEVLREEICHAENEKRRINIWLEVTLKLSVEQVKDSEALSKIFANCYTSDVPQRFRGVNPLDQRPGVTAGELFAPLTELVSPVWTPQNFEVIQKGSSPICHVSVEANAAIADRIIKLVGY